MRNKIFQGDALEILKTLPDECVHMCVTSPPYFGLRDYGNEKQVGLEETPEDYVQKLVEICREVRRVLRKDGTFWLVIGDSFASNGIYIGKYKEMHPEHTDLHIEDAERYPRARKGTRGGEYNIKAKDLIGIPWLVAFALRSDGWYLRRDIPWAKAVSFCPTYSGQCMPEPVRDRPTSSHEYVFLLTKSARYFYDREAVKEQGNKNRLEELGREKRTRNVGGRTDGYTQASGTVGDGIGRNLRSVWTINPHPYPEAHFATYPPELIEPMILLGTSEDGCCSVCGAPHKRVVEEGEPLEEWKAQCGADSTGEYSGESKKWLKQDELGKQTYTGFNKRWKEKQQNASDVKRRILNGMVEKTTVCWEPTCTCNSEKRSAPIVLDPFMGAGTTALVALKNARDFIGIELNPEYIALAEKRISKYRVKRLSEF